MEYNGKSVVVGIAEYVLIEAHRLLLVAAEEVDFYSCNAYLLEPFHLTLAGYRVVHYSARTLWSVVLCTVGIVPEHESDVLVLGIAGEHLDAVASYLLVPIVVDEYILIAEMVGKVDELALVVVVDGRILP